MAVGRRWTRAQPFNRGASSTHAPERAANVHQLTSRSRLGLPEMQLIAAERSLSPRFEVVRCHLGPRWRFLDLVAPDSSTEAHEGRSNRPSVLRVRSEQRFPIDVFGPNVSISRASCFALVLPNLCEVGSGSLHHQSVQCGPLHSCRLRRRRRAGSTACPVT